MKPILEIYPNGFKFIGRKSQMKELIRTLKGEDDDI